MAGMPKTVMVTARMPTDLVERIDAEAKRLGIPRSHYIERVLSATLRPSESPPAKPLPSVPRPQNPVAMKRQNELNKAKDKRS